MVEAKPVKRSSGVSGSHMSRIAIIHNIPIHYKHLLFLELARKGLDFEVLFLASGSNGRFEVPDLSSAPYRSRIGFQGRYEELPKCRTLSYVWRSLSEIQPRAVIIGGWSDVGAWTATFWCIFHGRPSVLWAESNYFDHPRVFWKELVKTAYLRTFTAAQVYGTTNFRYLSKLGFDPRRIWTKRAVADVKLFTLGGEVRPRHNSRRVILFVGRLAPEKNLDFVLEAVERLSSDAKQVLLLRIVGYGPLEGALRRRADGLGLGDMIEFAGPCAHSELPEVYHTADVVLLPSTSEPWGLTVNEGMLCGLPAIVSDRCGCAADLVNDGTGWSFNPYDAARFVQILEKVVAMPLDDLRTMGVNAAALSREYSPENCARIVMDCVSRTDSSAAKSP